MILMSPAPFPSTVVMTSQTSNRAHHRIGNTLQGMIDLESDLPILPVVETMEFSTSSALTLARFVIEACQLCSFALLPYHSWGSVAKGVTELMWFTNIPLFDQIAVGFIALLVISCVMIATLGAAIVIAVYCTLSEQPNLSMLVLSRPMIHLTTTVLFFPLLLNFVALSWCAPSGNLLWFPAQACYDAAGVVALCVSVVGCVMLVLLATATQLMLTPSSSNHFFSRISANVGTVNVMGKLLMAVLLHHFVAQAQVHFVAVTAISVGTVLWILTVELLPFQRQLSNEAHCSLYLTFLLLAGVAALSHVPAIEKSFVSESGVDLAVFIALAFAGAITGLLSANLRLSKLFSHRMSELQEGVIASSRGVFPLNLPQGDQHFADSREILSSLLTQEDLADETDDEFHFTVACLDFISYPTDVVVANRFLAAYHKVTAFAPTQKMLAFAARIYLKGILRFRHNAGLRLHFASFLTGYCERPRIASKYIALAEPLAEGLVDQYQLYVLRKHVSTQLSLKNKQRNARFNDIKEMHRKTLRQTTEFWQMVADEDVDTTRLAALSRNISSLRQKLGESYDHITDQHPMNVDFIASFALFCENVLQDHEAKDQCCQCLTEIRERKKARTRQGGRRADDKKELSTPLPRGLHQQLTTVSISGKGMTDFTRGLTLLLFVVMISFIVVRALSLVWEQRAIHTTHSQGQLRAIDLNSGFTALSADSDAHAPEGERLDRLISDSFGLLHAVAFGDDRASAPGEWEFLKNQHSFTILNQPVSPFTMRWLAPTALRGIGKNTSLDLTSFFIDYIPNQATSALSHSLFVGKAFIKQYEVMFVALGLAILGVGACILVCSLLLIRQKTFEVVKSKTHVFGLFKTLSDSTLAELANSSKAAQRMTDDFFKKSTTGKADALLGTNDSQGQVESEGSGHDSAKYEVATMETIRRQQGKGKQANTLQNREEVASTQLLRRILLLVFGGLIASGLTIATLFVPSEFSEAEKLIELQPQYEKLAHSVHRRSNIVRMLVIGHATYGEYSEFMEYRDLRSHIEAYRKSLLAAAPKAVEDLDAFDARQTSLWRAESVALRLVLNSTQAHNAYSVADLADIVWETSKSTSRPTILGDLSKWLDPVAFRRPRNYLVVEGAQADMNKSLDVRRQLAMQHVMSDEYTEIKQEALSFLDRTLPMELSVKTAALALAACAAAVSLLTLLHLIASIPVLALDFPTKVMPKIIVVVVTALLIAGTGGTIAQIVDRSRNTENPAYRLLRSSAENELTDFVTKSQIFTATMEQYWLFLVETSSFATTPLVPRSSSTEELLHTWFANLIPHRFRGRVDSSIFRQAEKSREDLIHSLDVAKVLILQSIPSEEIKVNVSTLNATRWDIENEVDSHHLKARYDDLYSTFANDSALVISRKKALAQRISVSTRVMDLYDALVQLSATVSQLIISASGEEKQNRDKRFARFSLWAVIGLASATAAAGGFVIWISSTMTASISAKTRDSGSAGWSLTTYSSMVFTLLLLGALAGVEGYRLRNYSLVDSHMRMDLGSQRMEIVARSMLLATEIVEQPAKAPYNRHELQGVVAQLFNSLHHLYFGPDNNEFFGVRDPEHDALLFDRDGFTSNPFSCNVTYGAETLNQLRRGTGLVYEQVWPQLIGQLIDSDESTASGIVAAMQSTGLPLLVGLQKSCEHYRNKELARSQVWATASLILAAVAVMYLVFQYSFIFSAFVEELLADEAASQLMLFTIPVEIREENAHISAYIESGQVTQSNQKLSDAIASMSTVPVISIDQQGNIIKFSNAAEGIFGYKASEVIGMNVKMLMPDEIAKNHDGYLGTYRRLRIPHVIGSTRRLKGRKADGTLIPIELGVRELRFSAHDWVYIGFVKDYSTEAASELSNTLNKKILEMSPACVITIDEVGTIQLCNPAVTTVFGYEQDELLGENVKMLMPSEIAIQHDGFLKAYKETGVRHVINKVLTQYGQKKNGEVFQLRLTVREIVQGDRTTFVAFITDVTEERKQEVANRTSDAITDLSPVPIIAITDHGTIVKFSHAASRVFGYNPTEVIQTQMNIQQLVPPSYGDHQKYIDRYKTTGVKRVIDTTRSITGLRRDKTLVPLSLTVKEIIKKGMDPMYLAYAVDVTENLALEERKALTAATAKYNLVPVVSMSPHGLITDFNIGAEKMFGYTAAEAVGQPVSILMHNSVASQHQAFVKRFLQTRESGIVNTSRVVIAQRKDKSQFPSELTLSFVPNLNDGGGLFTGYIKDITDRQAQSRHAKISSSVLEMSPNGIIVIDERGIVKEFSPAATTCFQYIESDIVGSNVSVLMTSEHASKHDGYLERYRRTGVSKVIGRVRTVPARRQDGSVFPAELYVREVLHQDMPPTYVAQIIDKSIQLQLEDETLVSGAVRDLCVVPVICASMDGKITYVNDSTVEEFQHQRKDLEGYSLSKLMSPEQGKSHEEILRKYAARVTADPDGARKRSKVVGKTLRASGVRKDGSKIDLELSINHMISKKSSEQVLIGYMRRLDSQLELEKANRTIEAITNLSSIPIVAIDTNGVIVQFSKSAAEVFGYSTEEAIGSNVKLLQTPEVAEKHDGFLKSYLKTGYKVAIGNVLRQEARRKDGTVIPIDLMVREIRHEGEDPLFIGYIRDATEEFVRQETSQLTEAVARVSPIPMIMINRKGTIEMFNAAAGKLFGYDPKQTLGNNVKMLMPEEVSKYHDHYLKQYAKSHIKTVIDTNRRVMGLTSSGNEIPLELMVSEVKSVDDDPKKVTFLGYVRDLTEEHKNQMTGAFNDAVVDMVTVPLIVIDKVGTIVRFSASAQECFGWTANEIRGQNVKRLMPEAIAEQHDGFLLRRAHDANPVPQFERRVKAVRRNGEEFVADLTVREILLNGAPLYIGSLVDINTRMQMSEQSALRLGGIKVAPLVAIKLTETHQIAAVSDASVKYLGTSEKEMLGKRFQDYLPQDSISEFNAALNSGSGASHAQKRIIQVKTASGQAASFQVSAHAIKDDGKTFVAVTLQDVEEAEKVAAAAALHSTIFEASTLPLICIDEMGTIKRFNPAASRVFGYSASEITGRNVKTLMPDKWADNHDGYLEAYRRTKQPHVLGKLTNHLQGKRKDGTLFNAVLLVEEILPAHESQNTLFVGCVRDVTERAELEQIDVVGRFLSSVAPQPLISINASGIIVQANPAVCDLFGYSTAGSDLIGQNIKVLMEEEQARAHDGFLARYASTREKHIIDSSRRVTARHRNGSRLEVELFVREAIRSENSSENVYTAFIEDLSKTKQRKYIQELPGVAATLVPVPTVVINSKGIIQSFNPAAEQVFEFSAKQVVGRNVNILMPTSMHRFHDQALADYMQTKKKKVIDSQLTVTGETKSGTQLSLQLKVKEVTLENGSVQFVGTLRPM